MNNVSKCFCCANKKDYDVKFGYYGCNYSGTECKNYSMFEPKFKSEPNTNADRIRAMSDEELATNFASRCCPVKDEFYNCGEINKKEFSWEDCKSCWLDWLKSPVEDDK